MYYLAALSSLGAEEPLAENAAIPADDFILDELILEEETPAPAAPVSESVEDDELEEVTSEKWMVPASFAIQIFSVVPGIAGGLAGFVLSSKLSNAKSVKATEVLMAAGSVALITFMSVFLVKTIDEIDKEG